MCPRSERRRVSCVRAGRNTTRGIRREVRPRTERKTSSGTRQIPDRSQTDPRQKTPPQKTRSGTRQIPDRSQTDPRHISWHVFVATHGWPGCVRGLNGDACRASGRVETRREEFDGRPALALNGKRVPGLDRSQTDPRQIPDRRPRLKNHVPGLDRSQTDPRQIPDTLVGTCSSQRTGGPGVSEV